MFVRPLSVQPVHNSKLANQADPRVDSDRTNPNYGTSNNHAYNSAVPGSTGAVGVSPPGTEAHNSNTSKFDSRPVGETGGKLSCILEG